MTALPAPPAPVSTGKRDKLAQVEQTYCDRLVQDTPFLLSPGHLSEQQVDRIILQLNRYCPQILSNKDAEKRTPTWSAQTWTRAPPATCSATGDPWPSWPASAWPRGWPSSSTAALQTPRCCHGPGASWASRRSSWTDTSAASCWPSWRPSWGASDDQPPSAHRAPKSPPPPPGPPLAYRLGSRRHVLILPSCSVN
ncbi:caspase recruitment domain-containing protein 19 isoform X3 [Myotis lucifugus]|uniref:caspase recruitment domain-containing protein 19 isoform X3 n=1 Tax=Myotis lucifugus TaxID=59463 RepID=UPI000CCBEEBA|nr:caspase recruitment domain-containing protein 19 isoform X3 [Myotis lucifugus]